MSYLIINIPVVVAVTTISVGVFSVYYLIHNLRKTQACKQQKMDLIKHWVTHRCATKSLRTDIRGAIQYYKRYSPELFEGLSDNDVIQIDKDLHKVEPNE